MKNKMKLLISALVVGLSVIVLVGCSCAKINITTLTIDRASIQTEYTLGEEVDIAGLKVTAKYSNNKTKLFTLSDFNTNLNSITQEVDGSRVFNQLGQKELIVTHKETGKTAKTALYVYADESEMGVEITGVSLPSSINAGYLTNIQAAAPGADEKEKQQEYKIRNNGYVVGLDNEFKFLPVVQARNIETDESIVLDRFTSYSYLQLKDLTTNEFNYIDEEDLSDYVIIDNLNSTYQFTENALGKTFKLSVRPFNIDEADYDDFTTTPFEFTVVEGWNAYSAADLSRIDNLNNSYWSEYKTDKGVGNEAISALILHNDITITASDLPTAYIWQTNDEHTTIGGSNYVNIGEPGSLKDWLTLYSYTSEEGDSFTLKGNYFTIDASQIPLVTSVINDTWMSTPHTFLFGIGGDKINSAKKLVGDFTFENLSILGNSARSEGQLGEGGLSIILSTSKNLTLDNTITTSSNRILFSLGKWENDENITTTLIKNSKGFDSYSSMVELSGANAQIINSEYKGAGGPLILLLHQAASSRPTTYYSTLNIDALSKLENYVSGEEAWFTNNAPGIASQLLPILTQLNNLANSVSEHELYNANGHFNLISVILDPDFGPYTIKGNLTLGEGDNEKTLVDMDYYYMVKAALGPYGAAPLFYTGEGQGMIFNPPNTFVPLPLGSTDVAGFFDGEYLTMYYNNMAIVLKFFAS